MKNIQLLLMLILLIKISTASETGSSCKVTHDCPDLHDCLVNICVHKPLFPITFREVMGTIFVFILNAIMTAGGVGAGAAYVPYIMLIFQHTLKKSIYIGYASVFGGGLGNLTNIITLKNPKTNRYMINFNTNMIILPALMSGVFIGVLLNRILPPFVTNIVLLMILGYSMIKNFFKVKENLAKERKLKQLQQQPQVQIQSQVQNSNQVQEHAGSEIQSTPDKAAKSHATDAEDINSPKSEINVERCPQIHSLEAFDKLANHVENDIIQTIPKPNNITQNKSSNNDSALAEKRERILRNEQHFPFHKLRELLINVIIIILIGLIRGSKKFQPIVGVEWTCGWDFLWFGLGILAFLINLVRSIYLNNKWQKEKLEVGYEFLPEDPLLTKSIILQLVFTATLAGTVGALVALGGALIVGPVLLDMGIPPVYSASTTGVFMIFTMFNAMFSTILDGKLSWQELAWFIPLCFVFSYLSSKLVNSYVKKTGKQSTVILLVMSGTIMGFVCILAVFIKAMVEDFTAQITFTSIC